MIGLIVESAIVTGRRGEEELTPLHICATVSYIKGTPGRGPQGRTRAIIVSEPYFLSPRRA
jgi:hypothetical protein